MLDVFIDALLDSLKVLAVAFVIYFLLSFIETNVSKVLEKNKKVSPLIGSALGLIPQCGMSVVSSDLYLKHHITMGTLVAVFIACSDEALPIMLSNPNKIIMVLPLILIKFVLGFVTGFIVDLFATKKDDETKRVEVLGRLTEIKKELLELEEEFDKLHEKQKYNRTIKTEE